MGLQVRGTDLHPLPKGEGFPYFQGDILQPDSLSQAMDGVECVIHTAGLAHIFDKSQALQAPFRLVNADGTLKVAQKAAKLGVAHFVLISSVAVYGRSIHPNDESVTCQPVGAYAESKLEAEKLACKIADSSGMRLTILRLATLYGEEDPGNVARLIRAIDRGRFIWVGNGSNRKSLLYRGDAVRACLITLQANRSGQIQIYNISAPSCLMRDIVDVLGAALGRKPPKWHIPGRIALAYASTMERIPINMGPLSTAAVALKKWLAEDVYASHKFEQTFQYKTLVSVAEGLFREVTWYRQVNKA
jgi:nucleoside-diphosphate-sugar epimerase